MPDPALARRRFLVTAGPTRERIDRVRDWGNVFTGTTGHAIAVALAAAGDVDLVTSNADHLRALAGSPGPLRAVPFVSHADLRQALTALTATHRYAGVFMTAAVSDYAPTGAYQVVDRRPDPADPGGELWTVRDVRAEKVKSTFDDLAVLGRRTEKLVDLFRGALGYRGLLVKFKLEVGIDREALIRVGQSSRRASGADYLVANTLDMVAGPSAGAYLLGDETAEWVPRGELPDRLRRLAEDPSPGRGGPKT
ncbi:MAG: phosphopantothenate--cysteine ligase [Phycisphaerales bacterium]|nr:phosphopantothenate--cysteine ligase [Phycisphaerales bacterium]